jgi:hypothetical protein
VVVKETQYTSVFILYLYGEYAKGQRDIEPGMVERCKYAPGQYEEYNCIDVAWHKVDGQQMQVLAHSELERVHVDCVEVAAGGGLLSVVMLYSYTL